MDSRGTTQQRVDQCPRCETKGVSATLYSRDVQEGVWHLVSGRRIMEAFARCGVCDAYFVLAGMAGTAGTKEPSSLEKIWTVPEIRDNTAAPRGTPEGISTVYNEARRAQQAGLYNAACTGGRTAMEHALAEQGHAKGSLKERTEKALKAGLVTARMADALTGVRNVGNMATHEAIASKADADLTLELCEYVLKDLYETPKRLEERTSAVEQE